MHRSEVEGELDVSLSGVKLLVRVEHYELLRSWRGELARYGSRLYRSNASQICVLRRKSGEIAYSIR